MIRSALITSACLLLLLACSTKKAETSIEKKSTQVYSIPQFSDSIVQAKMEQAFPVIEEIYRKQMIKNNYPSIAFGIIVNGKLVYTGNAGEINLNRKIASSPKSLYRIASMSKSFTAMAILKLRDEGKLNLHDPVSKYIPEMQKAGALTTDAPPINIQHLLTMSAGFPEDNPWGDRQLADSDLELLRLVSGGISFSNVPGTTFEYSNLGFALLGRTITTISGMPYQKYITTNIMKPIGMNDSKWDYNDVPDDRLALGYRWEDETWKEEALLHDGSYGAMGGLICSIEDFSKYVALHISAWPPRSEIEVGPVNRSTMREMHKPSRFNNLFADAKNRVGEPCAVASAYGYGLNWRRDCKGTVRVGHSGGLPGFGSEWRIYPEYGVGVVSFSNRTYGAPSNVNALALDTLIYLAGLKPRILPPSILLKQRQAQIVDAIKSWDDDQMEIFAENFFMDLSRRKWKSKTERLLEEAGEIVSIGALVPENQMRGSFKIVCMNKTLEVFFTLTPEAEALVQELDVWQNEE